MSGNGWRHFRKMKGPGWERAERSSKEGGEGMVRLVVIRWSLVSYFFVLIA